jgi:TPP-dependent trihydroxycyclohexane-1,2-dione (THcHDO) dehydratase
LTLKSKFCDLCHRPPTKGGSKTKYESCAKEIKGFIDSKARIIINYVDNDKYLDNDKSIDKLQQKTKVEKKKRFRKKNKSKKNKSQIDFKKQVMTFLTKSSKLKNKQAQKRHNEKMKLFRMFL